MKKEMLHFTLNGEKTEVEIDGWERALDVLRENLALTGTKRGCDDSTCGACAVVIDGRARKSCAVKGQKLEGKEVKTIEAMAQGFELHPIQTALINAGAVQCGYCIPGIVMELDALYTKNIDATREEILKALSNHFCRCTGYEAILDGALMAQEALRAK